MGDFHFTFAYLLPLATVGIVTRVHQVLPGQGLGYHVMWIAVIKTCRALY